jgi:hypothetical protein
MPNKPKPARTLLRPGADFDTRTIPVTRQPARTWFRVHRAGMPALDFGIHDYHRFSHASCPYPLLYVGPNVQTCLWETFGDDVFQDDCTIAISKWTGRCVSQITAPELKVCAISTERTREAMAVDKSSLLDDDLGIPQAWGLALQKHPAGFEAIKYTSRFVDQPCLALFDRGGLKSRLKVKLLGELEKLDAAVDWLHERNAALV